jgi:GT2 family glycosyltransferase
MAFRRAMLDQIGGFDERLGAGTSFPSEDIDAAAAVLWAGVPGAYAPRPVVYHHHGRKTEAEANALMRGYDAGRGAYFMKYILRKDSRTAFLRAWAGSIKGDFLGSFRKARLPQKTIRELSSGLRFALQCAASRRDR